MDWKEVIEGIVLAVFIALFVRTFLFANYKVPTDSMLPLLRTGDFFLGSKLHGGLRIPFTHIHLNVLSIKKNDVVTLNLNEDSRVMIARRVAALPNDVVEVHDHALFINGERKHDVSADVKNFNLKIPDNQFFASCEDTKSVCEDSVNWGLIPLNQIQAKALFIWLSIGDDAQDGENGKSSFDLRTERIGSWVTRNP